MAYPVPVTDPTAVFGRRVLAAVIDALIVIVPAILIASAQFEYLDVGDLPVGGQRYCDQYLEDIGGMCFSTNDRVYFSDGAGGPGTPLYWGLNFGLLVLLQAFAGWTPGKLLAGIRTVGEEGRPPGFVKALVRWLLWIVDGFPYFLPLVGFIVGLTTVGHRRVGDMAAKTFVVRASAAGAPIVVPGLTPAAITEPAPWGAPPPTAVGAPTTWGPAADPNAAGWASPPPVAPPMPTPTAVEGPQWDESRGTYIQWDPAQRAWMQWDEGFKAWSRIPGQ